MEKPSPDKSVIFSLRVSIGRREVKSSVNSWDSMFGQCKSLVRGYRLQSNALLPMQLGARPSFVVGPGIRVLAYWHDSPSLLGYLRLINSQLRALAVDARERRRTSLAPSTGNVEAGPAFTPGPIPGTKLGKRPAPGWGVPHRKLIQRVVWAC